MKASIIITTALVLNSSLLFGEGLSLVDGQIPLWALGGLESFLILVFVGDRFLKSLSKDLEIDFGHLNLIVTGASMATNPSKVDYNVAQNEVNSLEGYEVENLVIE